MIKKVKKPTPAEMIDPPYGYGTNYHHRPPRRAPLPKPSELRAREATLAKAIEKAHAGGWMSEYNIAYDKHLSWTATLKAEPQQPKNGLAANVTTMLSENDIIFNHDFAKALWGNDYRECLTCHTQHYYDFAQEEVTDPWRYHLRQMVMADDPIKYLGENLQ